MTSHALTSGRRLPSDRYLEIRYEEIVKHPSDSGAKLSEFLDLGLDGSQELNNALEDAHTGSIGRWKSTLSKADLAIAESEAGPLLTELGYGVNLSN